MLKQTQLAQAIADIHEGSHTVLQNLAPELRNNREVVIAAVQRNIHALQYASAEMRNDPEIVMTAVQQDPEALLYASAELRNNWQEVSASMASDRDPLVDGLQVGPTKRGYVVTQRVNRVTGYGGQFKIQGGSPNQIP